MLSMVAYIRSIRQQEGESARVHKLIAMLFGIVSHDFADFTWHWGINTPNTSDDQGFLRSMSHNQSYCKDQWNVNIGNDPSCHSIGDTGADMVNSKRGNLAFVPY